ncbi:MAG TPA: hypothetical protein VM936_15945 [Pyrinomonadaceae bacterium]|nr:hypothetical protein [Pyrinomonadaceae bacterium]
MPLRESSATALIRFTGLGIVCFNREKARGEVAVVRDGKHALSVKIQRPVFQDGGGGDVIVYQDVAAYGDLPNEGVTIEIGASGAGALEGYEIYGGGGEFDRLDSPDPHDFRWIVHIDSLHGKAAAVRPTGQRRHPLTKLYVAGGLFYTHTLDADLFFEKLEKDAGGRVTSREVFGSVGETMGVKLEGEEVVVRINVGGREEAHTLKRVEGLPYRVEIKNMDYSDDAVYSDMADYYGYLASPDGTEFDLAPMKEDGGGAQAAGGAVNQREFCHPIATDLDSIDSL